MKFKKLSTVFLISGVLIVAFSIISDLIRRRPFAIGPAQIGAIALGVLLIICSYLVQRAQTRFIIRNWLLRLIDYTKTMFKKEWFTDIVFLLIVIIATAIIGYIKIDTYHSWKYTSDLFTYYTTIVETARGNWGLEFTFGNAFGDHAYFFLLLLIPLVYVSKTYTLYALLLSGPFVFGATCIIFYFTLRQFTNRAKAFTTSVLLLLGFGITFISLYEQTYGMHPDTYSGYLAIAMVSFLLLREKRETQNLDFTISTVLVFLSWFLFVIQKEEMALLAAIFFLVVWVFKRTTFHRNLFICSVFFLGLDFLIIKISQTPFNRTNNALISNLVLTLQERGISFLFIDSNGGLDYSLTYWAVILICCISFLLTIFVLKKWSIYTISLFLIGLVFLLFSISVMDFSVTTWHTFPGIIMMIAAVLYQLAMSEKYPKFTQVIIFGLLIFSVYQLVNSNLPFLEDQLMDNFNKKPTVIQQSRDLEEIKKHIDPMKIVAVPVYTLQAWLDYRISFYPRGVYNSPIGIADYIVLNSNAPWDNSELTKFRQIFSTNSFVLLVRIGTSDEDRINREFFIEYGINDLPSINSQP